MPNCGPLISSLSSLTSTFGAFDASNAGYDDAYDTWVNGLNEGFSTEIMVWTNYTNAYDYDTEQATHVLIGGTYYDVYSNGSPVNNGSNTPEIIFAMNNQEASGSVDLLAIYNWIIQNHPDWFGYSTTTAAQAGAEISAIEYGMEISYTDGTQQFGVNAYSVTENGNVIG